jgi:oleandomycin transport system permease protein
MSPWTTGTRTARQILALAGRNLTKVRRNPGLFLDMLFMPITFLLLFVYLFGGAVAGSSRDYLQYLFPGILVMTTVLAGLTATSHRRRFGRIPSGAT